MEYYQPLFAYLASIGARRLKRAQLDIPTALRRKYLLNDVETGRIYSSSDAWQICRNYLGHIEDRMEALLSNHSVFYWLSLLRRTRPGLVSPYEDKTDPHTAALVWRIQELAIRKFAKLNKSDDVKASTGVARREILGGMFDWFMVGTVGEDVTDAIYRGIVASPQWVIVDFSLREYFALPRLQGLAYEYWRTTAAMRRIGKGTQISREDGSTWFNYVHRSHDIPHLIESYDQRIGAFEGATTLFGTWHDRTNSFAASSILRAYPNVIDVTFNTTVDEAVTEVYPNFLIDSVDLKAFWLAHMFMAEPYESKWGRRLDSLLITLWGLSNHVIFPNRVVDALAAGAGATEDEWRRVLDLALLQLVKRAYSTVENDTEMQLARNLAARCQVFDVQLSADASKEGNIVAHLRQLTLTSDVQQRMSIWSSGPFLPIIPHGEAIVIDLVSLTYVLSSVFYLVRDRDGEKGGVFELQFRNALTEKGFDLVQSGVLRNLSGEERDLDASVRIGDRLYLLECYASERPLDYEIGAIKTLETRINSLEKKCEQARSLALFVERTPKGANYDFTWASEIRALVVSPFVEWIWTREAEYWVTETMPLVVSADEVIAHLTRGIHRNAKKVMKQRERLKKEKTRRRYRKK